MPKLNQITLMAQLQEMLKEKYPSLEINMRHYNTIIRVANELSNDLNTPHSPAVPCMGIDAWLKCDETGASSQFMLYYITQYSKASTDYAHPHDVADFIRCRNMLRAVPELENLKHVLSNASGVWQGIIENWTLLCELIDENKANKAYALLSEIKQKKLT